MRSTWTICVAVAGALLGLPASSGAFAGSATANAQAPAIASALARDAAVARVPVAELRSAYMCLAEATKGRQMPREDLVDVAASIELTAGKSSARRAVAVRAMCDLLRASSL
jgi:hypothetical protein